MNKIKTLIILLFLTILIAETPVHADSQPQSEEEPVMVNELDAFYNLVIMIRFSDETDYQPPYSYEQYDHFFNGRDDVSLKDYFLEVSYDQLEITSLLPENDGELVFYTDSYERSYYEPHGSTNPDGYRNNDERTSREHDLIERAISYIDDEGLIDPSIDLDRNDDGMIDSLTFLVSGNAGAWNELLWPHRWELHTRTGQSAPTVNGIRAYDYILSLLDRYDSPNLPMHIGVIAHEMLHILSAPDLYHYEHERWIEPVGPWDIMERTSRTPRHMLGYIRKEYGRWIEGVDEITESGTYTLAPIKDGPENLYRIDTGYSDESIYIEYRLDQGRYESQLPDSGLIVYRIDADHVNEGNVNGFYNDYRTAVNEVFVYRPGLETDEFPLYLDDYNAGDVDRAALSQNNPYQAIGVDTSIPMFHSDGSQVELRIDSIVELPDERIRFDVDFNPFPDSENLSIDLVSDISMNPGSELILIDDSDLSYAVEITGVDADTTIYYTLDGSDPTLDSHTYTGDAIGIDADHHTVKAAVMEDGKLVTIQRSFTFADTIETAHNPYGNNQNISWFISFAKRTEFQLHFATESRFESGSDFLHINDGDRADYYSSTSLKGMVITYHKEELLLNFQSDATNDDFFGFAAEIVTDDGPPELELIGEKDVELDVFDDFEDPGTSIEHGEDMDLTVEVESDLDPDIVGFYRITYSLISDGETIDTVERTVDVVDREPPELILKPGIDTIGIGAHHIDQGAEASDNYDSDVTVETDATIDTTIPGNYVITYTAKDNSGNSRTIRRIVHVVEDHEPSFRCTTVRQTYPTGQAYHVPTCTFNGHEVRADTSSVNPDRAGTYPITYTTEYRGATHEHVAYIFFYDTADIDVAHMPFDRRML
ncbi:MAG: immunoglobulin-like domain-containing protein [Acholeplasmataceae bacterium]